MTKISVNPTPEHVRSTFVTLLSDYASRKGLRPLRPKGRCQKDGVKYFPRTSSFPMPDVVWLDESTLIWELHVMPSRRKFQRIFASAEPVENKIIAVDSLGNIGVIEPVQLLQFLKQDGLLIKEKTIQSLTRRVFSETSSTEEFHFKGRVKKNHQFIKEHFSLRIAADFIPRPTPGQFLQVMCDPAPHTQHPTYHSYAWKEATWPKLRGIELLESRPFLRRPFSIASYGPPSRRDDSTKTRRLGRGWIPLVRWAESELEIIYLRQSGGIGTGALTKCKVGDEIDVVGPLGRGFTLDPLPEVALLVGGGIGTPPLLFLAEELVRRGVEVKIFLGALTRSRIPFHLRGETKVRIPRFERLGITPVICTDDGSAGHHGLVTEPLSRYLERDCRTLKGARIFACGPRPMLAALQGIASRCDVRCEALLEERMACGFGACISCVCAVKETGQKAHFTRICTEGPAFDVKKVMWHA